MENAKDFTEVRSNDYRTKVKQLLQNKGEAINYQLPYQHIDNFIGEMWFLEEQEDIIGHLDRPISYLENTTVLTQKEQCFRRYETSQERGSPCLQIDSFSFNLIYGHQGPPANEILHILLIEVAGAQSRDREGTTLIWWSHSKKKSWTQPLHFQVSTFSVLILGHPLKTMTSTAQQRMNLKSKYCAKERKFSFVKNDQIALIHTFWQTL